MPDPATTRWTPLELGPAFPAGKPGFDPATATDAQLLALNLPPRPDLVKEPVLHAQWLELVAAPARTAPPTLTQNKALERGGAERPGRRKACQQSRNWAGAAAPARSGLRYTRVAGSWTIPAVTSDAPVKQDLSMLSAWIGLGGATRSSQSMPQIGSEHGWQKGAKVSRLWCQWWLGADEDGFLSWTIGDATLLTPGDRVLCSMVVTGPSTVLCHVRRTPAAAPQAAELFAILGEGKRPVVASSAEWIMERPRSVHAVTPPLQARLVTPIVPRRRQFRAGELADLPDISAKGPQPEARGAPPPRFRIEQAAARLGPAPRREVTPGQAALLAMVETLHGPSRLAEAIRPILHRTDAGEVLEFRIRRDRRKATVTAP